MSNEMIVLDLEVIRGYSTVMKVENLDKEDVFLPKSICTVVEGGIELPEWLAIKEGLV